MKPYGLLANMAIAGEQNSELTAEPSVFTVNTGLVLDFVRVW